MGELFAPAFLFGMVGPDGRADAGGSVARGVAEVERELEERVARLGYELVDAEWAGSARRPILRIRIDVPESAEAGRGVTVDDCAVVSRALEGWLDGLEVMPERYVLEVSSPGLDRPLTRPRDWERFVGERVAVTGAGLLAGRARRLEGELLGLLQEDSGSARVRLLLPGGDEVEIPKEEILKAHVVFRWKS